MCYLFVVHHRNILTPKMSQFMFLFHPVYYIFGGTSKDMRFAAIVSMHGQVRLTVTELYTNSSMCTSTFGVSADNSSRTLVIFDWKCCGSDI